MTHRRLASSRVLRLFLLVAVLVGTAAASANAGVIVSLGDSYSSGEGAPDRSLQTCLKGACTPPWDKGSGPCHRSPFAWPRLLGVHRDHHFACSGARIKHLSERRTRRGRDSVGQAEQLEHLDRTTEIDTVLLTIGGNDMAFAGKIAACYVGNCLRDLDKLDRELEAFQTRATAAYNLTADATSGDLVVVGYPDIVPSQDEAFRNCGWITDAEKDRLQYFEEALDRTLSEAAAAAEVDYLPIRDALARHELCTRNSWMNPVRPLGSSLRGHPNARGQQAMSEKVQAGLDALYGEG